MFLYKHSAGAGAMFVATQDEAKALKREKGGTFEKVDVPTTDGREALADFLNTLVASELEALPPEFAEVDEPAPPVSNVVPLQNKAQASAARTADDITAFILDEAEVYQVENILAAIGTRFGELAKGARK